MKESDIQKNIMDILKVRGAYVFKVQAATRAGVHDLAICYKGLFISIEVKAPNGKASALQLKKRNDVIKAGGISLITKSPSEVLNLLNEIDLERQVCSKSNGFTCCN